MTNTPCPDKAKLELMLLGKLPPAELESVGEHFLHCTVCANVAETIPASDGLTAAIQARKIFSGDEELLAQAIERAKGLRSQLQTADGQINATTEMQGQATQPNPSAPALDYDLDFLALAEQPDELGRLGGYRILEVMGVGGMGLVFRAEDPKLERMVALKVMKPTIAASKSAKDRFLREAKATAALDHHNIVQIFQVGEDRGVPYIAMQYLRGESLQTRLSRDKQLAQADVLRIGREVADGLQVAHDRGLIHRDIKPDNIWLDAKTGAGKLLDFGLARAAADNAGLTQDGTVLGTPRYMSPEQSLGQTVDFRCDLFSLGSVLYHLAAGRPAFDGSNLTATLIAVAQANPQSIDKLAPKLHPELSRLIMRLLAKDRDQRPQSAAEVSRAIADIEKQLAAARAEPLAPTIEIRPKVDRSLRDRSTSSHGVTRLLWRNPVFLRSSIALAALAFLIACGVIIIKITNKDGTTVEITLPDDVKKVEITESEIPNPKSQIPNPKSQI